MENYSMKEKLILLYNPNYEIMKIKDDLSAEVFIEHSGKSVHLFVFILFFDKRIELCSKSILISKITIKFSLQIKKY